MGKQDGDIIDLVVDEGQQERTARGSTEAGHSNEEAPYPTIGRKNSTADWKVNMEQRMSMRRRRTSANMVGKRYVYDGEDDVKVIKKDDKRRKQINPDTTSNITPSDGTSSGGYERRGRPG